MSVEAKLKAALGPFGDPVEANLLYAAADQLPPRYYTFALSSRGPARRDEAPRGEVWQGAVHLVAPLDGHYAPRQRQTKEALHRAGFTWPRCVDASDQEGQHLVFECEIVEEVEVDGEI